MACRIFNRNLLRKLTVSRNFIGNGRWLSHYPIDETIFGLTDDQISVGHTISLGNKLKVMPRLTLLSCLQLRETIFNFAQKELAPYAQEIDKNNGFKWVNEC